MILKVLSVTPLRSEHQVRVEMTWTTGFWFWVKPHSEIHTFLTSDGVMWRKYDVNWQGVGGDRGTRRVGPQLEDGLWRALEAFQRRMELEI